MKWTERLRGRVVGRVKGRRGGKGRSVAPALPFHTPCLVRPLTRKNTWPHTYIDKMPHGRPCFLPSTMTGPVLMLLLASASSFFFKSPYPAATATSGACMARHPNGRSRAVLMPYANDQQGDGIASSTNESPIRAAVVTDKAKADSEGSR